MPDDARRAIDLLLRARPRRWARARGGTRRLGSLSYGLARAVGDYSKGSTQPGFAPPDLVGLLTGAALAGAGRGSAAGRSGAISAPSSDVCLGRMP